MLCKKCSHKNRDIDSALFKITSFMEFLTFIEPLDEMERKEQFLSHEHNGYPWAQFMVWKYVENRHRHRDPVLSEEYRKILMWTLQNVDAGLIQTMFSEGLPEDGTVTAMHYLVKSLPYLRKSDEELVLAFRAAGLGNLMDAEDSTGKTVEDYIRISHLGIVQKRQIYAMQREMKEYESILINSLQTNLPHYFQNCSQCAGYLSVISDIRAVPADVCHRYIDQDVLRRVVELRTQIAKSYVMNDDRHAHCLDVWTSKLL
jgi:hypothetical protein